MIPLLIQVVPAAFFFIAYSEIQPQTVVIWVFDDGSQCPRLQDSPVKICKRGIRINAGVRIVNVYGRTC